MACSHCLNEISADRVSYRDGPGAGTRPIPDKRKTRRSADPTALERRRPSSVARALRVIGDRWSFMIIREPFLRVRRFDDLQMALGIAPNILIDRLQRLVADGIFDRVRYHTGPDRHGYRFSAKGRDRFGSMIAMLRWGDDWLSGGKPPLQRTHLNCGHDVSPVVVCNQCRQAISATEMRCVVHDRVPVDVAG